MDKNKITGIILAGGKSRRMGVEKGLLKFGGKHLIEFAIAVLEPLCKEIIISENTKAYDFLGFKVIPDIYPNSGPMGGIYSALKNSKTDLNLVLSCDMPFITTDLLNHLIEQSEDYDVVVPWHGQNLYEPLCALYHKNSLPVLEDFIRTQNFKLPDAFGILKTQKILISKEQAFYQAYLFHNLNSKDELEKANEILDEVLPTWDRLLLIAGTGRNVGKTRLACDIIAHISQAQKVIGLKISPHVHSQNEKAELIFSNEHFSIFREYEKDSGKDSSRMLQAGASKVFYIQSEDRFVGKAFQVLSKELDKDIPIVCESGGLRNFIKPSLFLICRNFQNPEQEKHQSMLDKADHILDFADPGFDFKSTGIQYNNGKWLLK